MISKWALLFSIWSVNWDMLWANFRISYEISVFMSNSKLVSSHFAVCRALKIGYPFCWFNLYLCIVGLPGVLSVRPDPDHNSVKKDYSSSNIQLSNMQNTQLLFPAGTTKHWLVRMDKPGVGVVTKAQMVDYYAQILTKVLGK